MMTLFLTVLIALSLAAVYLIPHFMARDFNHPDKRAITVVNILLGWTGIGWVIAFVWAYRAPKCKR